MAATLDDYRWLVSGEAQPWLAQAGDELQHAGISPRYLQRLRKDLSAERAHLVVEQVELRERAREKFSLADQMFFTRKGLEQATDEVLANYKAARFPGAVIADLCCGIGGDLMALLRRGFVHVFAIDQDRLVLEFATANLRLVGNEGATLIPATVSQFILLKHLSAWHCDPDRRADGQRTTQLELCEPSLSALDDLRKSSPNAAIKLAPATEVPPQWWNAAEREWLGSRGECRQQVCWFGSLARHPGNHAATVVAADGSARTIVGKPTEAIDVAVQLGRYLFEPHAAVLAASLLGAVCREHSLASVSAGIGYLTGDRPIADPALAAFEIREVLPFDRKQLRGWCREHHIGRLEIKKRGVEVDPEKLRAEIIVAGNNAATLIIAPIDGQVRALVAQRTTTGY